MNLLFVGNYSGTVGFATVNLYLFLNLYYSLVNISKMGAGLKMGILSGAPSPTEPAEDLPLQDSRGYVPMSWFMPLYSGYSDIW